MNQKIIITKNDEIKIRSLISRSECLNDILPEKFRTFDKDDLLRTANFFYYVNDIEKAIEYTAKVLIVNPVDKTALANMKIFLNEIQNQTEVSQP